MNNVNRYTAAGIVVVAVVIAVVIVVCFWWLIAADWRQQSTTDTSRWRYLTFGNCRHLDTTQHVM